jgi:hypothetical protein
LPLFEVLLLAVLLLLLPLHTDGRVGSFRHTHTYPSIELETQIRVRIAHGWALLDYWLDQQCACHPAQPGKEQNWEFFTEAFGS